MVACCDFAELQVLGLAMGLRFDEGADEAGRIDHANEQTGLRVSVPGRLLV
jgi:hypothetical protein